MRRIVFALALVCVLAPATARADEGGFWEFIWGLDPKLQGGGSEIHLLCLDAKGMKLDNCEEWWWLNKEKFTRIGDLKHELDFRFAYYREYGFSYESVNYDANSINTWKLMAVYKYYPDRHISVGLGAGIMPFYGKGSTDNQYAFTRAILMPLSLTYYPSGENSEKRTKASDSKVSFYIRGEASFIPTGFSPHDFGSALPAPTTRQGEWSVSVATGFDFRRRFLKGQ
jgi:hypothetical protein